MLINWQGGRFAAGTGTIRPTLPVATFRANLGNPLMTEIRKDSSTGGISVRQQQCRSEWRQLCETLEAAQGDELCRTCRDKYQFIKTYRVYGRDLERFVIALKKSATVGQYQFFCDRGVPRDVLTPTFVEWLLEDWKSVIDAKRRHVAEVYRFKFNENIDTCIVTGEDSARLSGAESMHTNDALHHLTGMAQPAISFRDVESLRAEIQDLRDKFDQLSGSLQAEMANLKQRLDDVAG